MDRRIKKTNKALKSALIRLMKEKEIRKITVKDITEEADINRGTFYLHYLDIYDMIEKVEKEIIDNILNIVKKNGSVKLIPNEDVVFSTLLEVIDYLQNNIELCRALVGKNGDLSFVKNLEDIFVKTLLSYLEPGLDENDKIAYYYYIIFVVSGGIGAVRSWILSKEPAPVNQLIYTFKYIIKSSINKIFGGKDD